jgi:hypothetical protein
MDAKQEYRDAVKNTIASTGRTDLSDTQKADLDSRFQSLGLAREEVAAIEDDVIKNFQAYELEIVRLIVQQPVTKERKVDFKESGKIQMKKLRENLELNHRDVEVMEAQIFEEYEDILQVLSANGIDVISSVGMATCFVTFFGSIVFPPLMPAMGVSFLLTVFGIGPLATANSNAKQYSLGKKAERRKAWGVVLREIEKLR